MAEPNTTNYASPKSDLSGPDAAPGGGAGCIGESGASTKRQAEKNHYFQGGERGAWKENFEEIQPAGAGTKSPNSRPHFRDPASACKRRLVRGKTEREMGRFDNGSDQKIPGSAWAESDGKARCENPSAIGPWLSDRGRCAALASGELFIPAEYDALPDGPRPAVSRRSSRLHSIDN